MKDTEHHNEDSLLMDLLYEEANGGTIDPALRKELLEKYGEEIRAYREIRTAYRSLEDEDPAPQVSARILREAAKVAPAAAAGKGLLDKFLSLFRLPTFGWAGAAAVALLVVGVGFFAMNSKEASFDSAMAPGADDVAEPSAHLKSSLEKNDKDDSVDALAASDEGGRAGGVGLVAARDGRGEAPATSVPEVAAGEMGNAAVGAAGGVPEPEPATHELRVDAPAGTPPVLADRGVARIKVSAPGFGALEEGIEDSRAKGKGAKGDAAATSTPLSPVAAAAPKSGGAAWGDASGADADEDSAAKHDDYRDGDKRSPKDAKAPDAKLAKSRDAADKAKEAEKKEAEELARRDALERTAEESKRKMAPKPIAAVAAKPPAAAPRPADDIPRPDPMKPAPRGAAKPADGTTRITTAKADEKKPATTETDRSAPVYTKTPSKDPLEGIALGSGAGAKGTGSSPGYIAGSSTAVAPGATRAPAAGGEAAGVAAGPSPAPSGKAAPAKVTPLDPSPVAKPVYGARVVAPPPPASPAPALKAPPPDPARVAIGVAALGDARRLYAAGTYGAAAARLTTAKRELSPTSGDYAEAMILDAKVAAKTGKCDDAKRSASMVESPEAVWLDVKGCYEKMPGELARAAAKDADDRSKAARGKTMRGRAGPSAPLEDPSPASPKKSVSDKKSKKKPPPKKASSEDSEAAPAAY